MMQNRARISSPRRLSSSLLLLLLVILFSENVSSFSVHPFISRGSVRAKLQRPPFHCQFSSSNKLFQTTKNEQNTSEEEIPTKPSNLEEKSEEESSEIISKKNYVDNPTKKRKTNRGFLPRIRLLRGKLSLPLKWNKRQIMAFCLTLTISALILVAVASASTNYHPASWMPTIDLNRANQQLKMYLNRLNNAGMVGLVLYAGLLWAWTIAVGITTPVETAAGFCFGAQKAIPASACGKIGGALTAFYLGRYIFQDKAREMLHQHQFLELVQESATEHPFPVAVMTRFAPLPEFVKNFGMSMTQIPLRSFALAVILHGLPFTCLWSCIGAETAKLVALQQGGGVATSSKALKAMVTGMTWFGAFVSPALMGWWIRSLRKKAAAKSNTSSTS